MTTSREGWDIWVDRGGTFTDIVASDPEGGLHVHKLLSMDPDRYEDAVVHGIKEVLGEDPHMDAISTRISSIRMGTTVGTNALLERKGERCALIINSGFSDLLRIGNQDRPDIFALDIMLPSMLYEEVIEIKGRIDAEGNVIEKLELSEIYDSFRELKDKGFNSLAVVLFHSYINDSHEKLIREAAIRSGFGNVSISSDVSRLMRMVGRGDTTVVDSYLSPILLRYIEAVKKCLSEVGTKILFMQSHGGLIDAESFRGKDCILSGPAGGVIGGVRTSQEAGFEKVITFDMGGTSTDVAHFSGEYERTYDSKVAGVRIRSPMLRINTVAAGGGSIITLNDGRIQVGPGSAGADPGPMCYRKGGPLTVTDCNVMLGRISPRHFPSVFGPDGRKSIDVGSVKDAFVRLSHQVGQETGMELSPEQLAEGCLKIAVENMSQAIKTISVQRGYDVTDHVLCSFGGAGGQHACSVAERLGMSKVIIHPFAGVLSALGMGLASVRIVKDQSVEISLEELNRSSVNGIIGDMKEAICKEFEEQSIGSHEMDHSILAHIRYQGSDTSIPVDVNSSEIMKDEFEELHRHRFGFLQDRDMVVSSITVEGVSLEKYKTGISCLVKEQNEPIPEEVEVYFEGDHHKVKVYRRGGISTGTRIDGPALIMEDTGTNYIAPGWTAEVDDSMNLVLERKFLFGSEQDIGTKADPVMLEIFNRLFMSIAEQMGYSLMNTAHSVNIKERLDFSCALFDEGGELVANAPHIPVHLGSMSESVLSWLKSNENDISPGDVFLLNSPYNGGTHLPDVTVITPVFSGNEEIIFFTASRGHHSDIGGITPGSMPPDSSHIDEEGAIASGFKVVEGGVFQEGRILEWLTGCRYPARDPERNMADLKAQIAANEKGSQELGSMVDRYGLETVKAYMKHVRDNAESSVRKAITVLKNGSSTLVMDNGARISVKVEIDRERRTALIDFHGTSGMLESNFNAPKAVVKAAVLYVFRTLVRDPIPLNGGCLRPIEIRIPEGSMLDPAYPSPVAAGNVETSQHIVDALYDALGVMAGSQGTMNNLTFGNEEHQYYETICGGTGAGQDFHGTDAVHSHMTNTRMTDPEVLESRYPVRLLDFSIRKGSGGDGARKGGNGIRRVIEVLEPMKVSMLSSHRSIHPKGSNGGYNGALGRNTIIRIDGSREDLGGCGTADLGPGERLEVLTPGGGGHGQP